MNDYLNSLPRETAVVLVFLSASLGAFGFLALIFWIISLLTRRVAVKDQVGFQLPPVGCDTSAARQTTPIVRVVPWDEWKRSLDMFVSGNITLDEHVEKFSGCVIGKKPTPEDVRKYMAEPVLVVDEECRKPLRIAPGEILTYECGSAYYYYPQHFSTAVMMPRYNVASAGWRHW